MSLTVINGTKVTIGISKNCLSFRTLSRQHSRSVRFLVVRTTLSNWLEGDKSERCDSDLGNFLRLQKRGENLHLTFTWLSGSDDRLYGHNENIIIPMSLVQNLLACESDEIQYLHADRTRPSRVNFSNASRTLKECITDKRAKRALSKALRDRHWRDTSITMYNDGCPKCFFFTERGKWNMEGGLILHKSHTKDIGCGKFPKLYYSVHT